MATDGETADMETDPAMDMSTDVANVGTTDGVAGIAIQNV